MSNNIQDLRDDIYTRLSLVHQNIKNRYNINSAAQSDVVKARKMETYLRAFKAIGNGQAHKKNGVATTMENDAIIEIAQAVGASLKISRYHLFKNRHFWYAQGKNSSQSKWGTDDVFETELQHFLNIALDRAVSNSVGVTRAESVGQMPSNLSKEMMRAFDENKHLLIKPQGESEIISPPVFRSAKVDVNSFNGVVEAAIKPGWHDFISTFQGARFTVKNYSSSSNYMTIHLGDTDIKKSLLSSLQHFGLSPQESMYVFTTLWNYPNIVNDAQIAPLVIQLRFAYELAGGGLRDEQNHALDEADFFIYNDPHTNNIYVRSTKAMILNALNYSGRIKDPLHSSIVVLKNKF